MKQDRTLLEHNLIKPTLTVKRKRSVVRDIKQYLAEKYSIFDGLVQSWINDPSKELKNIDARLLYLFAEQIFVKTGDININPEDYFTSSEIKTAKQFNGKLLIDDEIELPLTLNKFIQIDRDSWSGTISNKLLVGMHRSRLLNWNPEVQREATYKKVNGEIIEEATLYMENVKEIKKLLNQGELETTQIILNCSLGTGDGDEEVIYNPDSFELTILPCKIDIIDGFHRLKGGELAISENPDLDFTWEVKILNMSVPRAGKYFSQINKRTPVSETKRKIVGKETYTDMLIDELKKSKLGDRVSKKEKLTTKRNEIVTYGTLSYAIEKYFKIERKVDMYRVADYLNEFFDILLEVYDEEFNANYSDTKKKSLVNSNVMFVGYVILASKMREKGVEARKVIDYVKDIDFNKNNNMWEDIGVIDENKNLTNGARKEIEELFSSIVIKEEGHNGLLQSSN